MSNKNICSLLGEISICFATIEHRLIDHLAYLLTKSDITLVSPYVLDRLPISQLIKQTQSVAELRLSECSELFDELKAVLKIIEDLRQQRNLFIHGDWFTEELKEDSKYVTVLDYKPKLDKNTKVWKYMNVKKVSHEELKEMLDKVKGAFEQLVQVCNKIWKVKLR
jgi:hypothetical protein